MLEQSTKYKVQRGQALVIVLLSLAVVVTIVLFVLSRSVTDIAVSDSESQSVSAFSAAEAGVERALVIGVGSGGDQSIGDATYNAQVSDVARGATNFIYPVEPSSGDTMTLWLKSPDGTSFTGNTLKICWGKTGTPNNVSTTPAIEVSVFYESDGTPVTAKIFRAAADPYSSRSPINSFNSSVSASTIGTQPFPFCTTLLNLTSLANLQFASIKMFYNTTPQPIGFDAGSSVFPSQGINIDSSGTSGQSSRKVQVFQGWPEVPGPFLSGIYSTTGITKN
jgi:hypothetical protein